MYKGSCLCGEVKFEVQGPIESVINCHCIECRKAQGAAFGTNGFVNLSDFKIISGSDNMKSYESSPGKQRCFCGNCGSPIISKRDAMPDKVRVRLGTLDGEIKEQPTCHLFVGEKANWLSINDSLPQYEGFEPSR